MSRQLSVRLVLPLAALTALALAFVLLVRAGADPRPQSAAAQAPAQGCPATRGEPIRDGFVQPEERRSVNGVLDTTLRMSSARAYIRKANVRSTLYERMYPGPTLRVCPGDTLRVKLINDTKQPTNLHVHGMHVSPSGSSDNVLLDIPPGGTQQYEYRIPLDQTPGTYWYHPHRHEYTEPQVWNGMAGMLIVDGKGYDDLPGIAGARERSVVIMANQLQGDAVMNVNNATNDGVRFLVNGRLRPKIDIRPGEVQRWRILNASADYFVRLQLSNQDFNVIATDGNPARVTNRQERIILGGGERVDVLVRGRARGATLETRSFKQGFLNTRPAVLADLQPVDPVEPEAAVPDALVPFEDLRAKKVDRTRQIVYSETPNAFLINGKPFGHHRVDQTMKLNTTEEWTIRNVTDEWHSFHIHVNPFQVTKIDGKAVDRDSYEDTVRIGPNGGSVTIRQRFRDFTGKFVFHCHILGHEDGGMMSLVQVVK